VAMSVTCPTCAAEFRAGEQYAGRVAKCPGCQKPFRLPTAAADVGSAAAVTSSATAATILPTQTERRQATAAAAPPVAAAQIASTPATAKQTATPAQKPATPKGTGAKSPSREQIAQQIMAGFTGPIRRPRTPIMYQLAAIVVFLLMIALPLVYLSLIALAGYGVYYHAVNHTGIVTTDTVRNGKAKVAAVLIYLGPIVAGVVLIVFMIKPLFARPVGGGRTRSLRRESEPLLFAFVDRICETVGAPKPRQIDVDCEVNASARFRRGMLSMIGNDLALTIGMPLIAGLNTRQFGGVLAHEFGHFSQGFGMRLSYMIRSLSHWFMRLVYQRDRADQWLEENASEFDIRIGWILYLAMAFVWLSRKVLWVLMYVGHFFGSFLLRQMEFDADRFETRFAGSGAFEQTARQLQTLNVASQAAFSDLREFYREGRLGDDLPRLIMARTAAMPEEVKKAIDKSIGTSKTGLFDTHPCDADRIVAAKREDTDGVFRVELPATALLSDFDAHAKASTLEFYRGIFGNDLKKAELRPVTEITAKHEQAREQESAIERFFGGEWSVAAPLQLDSYHVAPPQNAAAALAELKEVRRQMAAKIKASEGAAEALSKANRQSRESHSWNSLLRARVKVNKKALAEAGGADEIKRRGAEAERLIGKSTNQLRSLNELAAKRISLGLALLHVAKVVERLPETKPKLADVDAKFMALQTMCGTMEALAGIAPLHTSAGGLIEALQGGGRADDIVPILEDLMGKLLPRAKTMRVVGSVRHARRADPGGFGERLQWLRSGARNGADALCAVAGGNGPVNRLRGNGLRLAEAGGGSGSGDCLAQEIRVAGQLIQIGQLPRLFYICGMTGTELAVFALLLLAGGLANYRFAEPIAAVFHRWIPDSWESEPSSHRLSGQLMSASGIILFATSAVTG
jgi:hypothetical protein